MTMRRFCDGLVGDKLCIAPRSLCAVARSWWSAAKARADASNDGRSDKSVEHSLLLPAAILGSIAWPQMPSNTHLLYASSRAKVAMAPCDGNVTARGEPCRRRAVLDVVAHGLNGSVRHLHRSRIVVVA